MRQIVFRCPPTKAVTGGIKHLFKMAEVLRELGFDAIVCVDNGQRPIWFASTAPIKEFDQLRPDANQILVIPEDQLHVLPTITHWPQKLVIYIQNEFYSGAQLSDGLSYRDYGVMDVISTTRSIDAYIRHRHPGVKSHLVPYAIDTGVFKPAQIKREAIAYLPRKRPIEASYLRDSFRYAFQIFVGGIGGRS